MKLDLSNFSKHIIFWLAYLFLWSMHDLSYNTAILENLRTNLMPFVLYASLVYVNLYTLIPIFLLKKKLASYILLLVICVIIVTIATSRFLSFYFLDINTSTSIFFHSLNGILSIITEVIISLTLSMTLYLLDEWYKKEKLITELQKVVPGQEFGQSLNNVNPHLLLNSQSKIYAILNEKLNSDDGHEHIFIKSNGMVIKIYVNNITYIETASDYVYINTINKDRYLTLVSLRQLEGKLPSDKFVRVHRYYLIGIKHVQKLDGNLVYVNGERIKISRSHRSEVYQAIIRDKLIER